MFIQLEEPKKYFKKKLDTESHLLLSYETDYIQASIMFDKRMKTVEFMVVEWQDNNNEKLVLMEDRPLGTKHSMKYGKWVRSSCEMPIPLFNYIAEIMKDVLHW